MSSTFNKRVQTPTAKHSLDSNDSLDLEGLLSSSPSNDGNDIDFTFDPNALDGIDFSDELPSHFSPVPPPPPAPPPPAPPPPPHKRGTRKRAPRKDLMFWSSPNRTGVRLTPDKDGVPARFSGGPYYTDAQAYFMTPSANADPVERLIKDWGLTFDNEFAHDFFKSLKPVVATLLQFKKLRRLIVDDMKQDPKEERKNDSLLRKFRRKHEAFENALLESGVDVLKNYTLPVAMRDMEWAGTGKGLVLQWKTARDAFYKAMEMFELFRRGHVNVSVVKRMTPCPIQDKLPDVALEFFEFLIPLNVEHERVVLLLQDLRLLANRPMLQALTMDEYAAMLELYMIPKPKLNLGATIFLLASKGNATLIDFLKRLYCAMPYEIEGVDDEFHLPMMLERGYRPQMREDMGAEEILRMFYEILTMARIHVDFRLYRTMISGKVHKSYPKLHRIPNPLKNTWRYVTKNGGKVKEVDEVAMNKKITALRNWLDDHRIYQAGLVIHDARHYKEYGLTFLVKLREMVINTLEANNCDLAAYGSRKDVESGLAKYEGSVVKEPFTGQTWVYEGLYNTVNRKYEKVGRQQLFRSKWNQIRNVAKSNRTRRALAKKIKLGENTLHPYCTRDLDNDDAEWNKKFGRKKQPIPWPCVETDNIAFKDYKRIPNEKYKKLAGDGDETLGVGHSRKIPKEGSPKRTRKIYNGLINSTRNFDLTDAEEKGGDPYYGQLAEDKGGFPTDPLFFSKARHEEDEGEEIEVEDDDEANKALFDVDMGDVDFDADVFDAN